MTIDDIYNVINDLRKNGYEDEDIAHSFVSLFITDKITIEQCNMMVNLLGFHIPKEILCADIDVQKEYAIKFLNKK